MAKKKLAVKTVNQRLWDKEIQRIKRFMKRAEKRGYLFNYDLPERPTRVTKKQLDLIRSVRPDTLYASADYIADYETGEVISGLEGRRLERHRAAVKAAETRRARTGRTGRTGGLSQGLKAATQERLSHIAVTNVRSLIRSLFGNPEITGRPDDFRGSDKSDKVGRLEAISYISEMENILNRAIAEFGEEAVGQAIIDAPEEALEQIIDGMAVLTYRGEFASVLGDFATVIKGTPLSMLERQNMEKDLERVGAGFEEPI